MRPPGTRLSAALRRELRASLRRAAATVAPHVPRRALGRVVAARSRRAGLAVGLPSFERVLMLAPHPDDESLSAGGTLARLAGAGTAITVVAVTDGESSLGSAVPAAELGRRRRAELQAAAAILGAADVRFLGHPDGRLHDTRGELSHQLRELLAEIRPDLIVLPWAGDDPGDHAAVNQALAEVDLPRHVAVWGGEVWNPVPANRIVDITEVCDRKRAALAEHASAGGAFDLEAILGLNRYRSIRGLRGRGYAEAFLTCTGDAFRELVAAVTAADITGPDATGGDVAGSGTSAEGS